MVDAKEVLTILRHMARTSRSHACRS
jgi:hypothetical protein